MQRNLDMLFVNTVGRQYKIHNPKSITSGVRTLYPYTVYGIESDRPDSVTYPTMRPMCRLT